MTEQETDEVTSEVSARTEGWTKSAQAALMLGITDKDACSRLLQELCTIGMSLPKGGKGRKSRHGFISFCRAATARYEFLLRGGGTEVDSKVDSSISSVDVNQILDETTLEESRVEEEEKSIRRGLKAQVENTLSHLKLISSEGPWRVVEKLTSPPSVTFFSERGGNYLIFVTLGASEEGSSNTYESEFTLTGSRVSYSHPKCVVYQGKGKDRAGNPYRGKSAIYSNSSTSNGVTLCVTATAIFDVGQTSAESNFVRRLRSENSREYKCVNITSDTYIRINGCFFRVEKNENTSNTKT